MSTLVQDKKYIDVQEQIKRTLLQAIKREQINAEDALAILFLFSFTKTVDDLYSFIETFSPSFPILMTMQQDKLAANKSDYELKIKEGVGKIVTKDPIKAAEFAKAAMEPNVSWQSLEDKYPEIKEI